MGGIGTACAANFAILCGFPAWHAARISPNRPTRRKPRPQEAGWRQEKGHARVNREQHLRARRAYVQDGQPGLWSLREDRSRWCTVPNRMQHHRDREQAGGTAAADGRKISGRLAAKS